MPRLRTMTVGIGPAATAMRFVSLLALATNGLLSIMTEHRQDTGMVKEDGLNGYAGSTPLEAIMPGATPARRLTYLCFVCGACTLLYFFVSRVKSLLGKDLSKLQYLQQYYDARKKVYSGTGYDDAYDADDKGARLKSMMARSLTDKPREGYDWAGTSPLGASPLSRSLPLGSFSKDPRNLVPENMARTVGWLQAQGSGYLGVQSATEATIGAFSKATSGLSAGATPSLRERVSGEGERAAEAV